MILPTIYCTDKKCVQGSYILSTLLALPSISTIHSLSRRAPSSTDPKLHAHVSSDSAQWATNLTSVTPAPSIFFSGLATTRGIAGSLEEQRKIDLDLNLEIATAAKKAGVKVYVLISASGANSKSYFAYPKMKGELEDGVAALGFDHAIFIRPGMIIGDRTNTRPIQAVESALMKTANVLSNVGLKDFWAQDADIIAKAAVNAGLQALADGTKPKVWELPGSEIVRLGRTEWKD